VGGGKGERLSQVFISGAKRELFSQQLRGNAILSLDLFRGVSSGVVYQYDWKRKGGK